MQNEPETTIEKKSYSPEQTDEALVRALRGKNGRVTKADAIALSGLPSYLVDDSLERLLGRYRSRLEVTEEGELLYSFDPKLQRRDVPTFAERMRALGRVLARAGVWVFKAWIAITLVVYVLAFIALMLAMMFSGNDRRRDDRGFGGGLGWLWWFLLPDWRYGGYGGYGGYGYRTDAWGRPIRAARPHPRLGGRQGPKKKFIYSVFDFVFGPARPTHDKLADEREILAYIRENDGRITATDLVKLFGWSYPRAEEEVTRLLVDYEGDPEVTDEGVIIYEFPKLLKTAEEPSSKEAGLLEDAARTGSAPGRREGAAIGRGGRSSAKSEALVRKSGSETVVPKPCWERLETRPIMTGNGKGTDIAIGLFAFFNLFMSFFAAGWARTRFGLAGPGWDFALTGFPLTFFAIFLTIPLARLGLRRLGDRGREARNQRRFAIKQVMEADGKPLPTEPALDALLVPLQGEPEVGSGGEMLLRFPRVAEEREALAKHLSAVDVEAEKRVGKVIFGGDDEEVPQLKN